ncbi:MmcQ/YjbR family DNA-binding protein [Kordiimonas sp. SCSIO 12610]|uniref:MmcQ/YjbR family DNA-binding protein n=1 Tax=Kordiimonas sp. SCSIO 12610 TaxID=2829597 RepID=UPI00210D5DC7|nr:MmcQ/YjbR family DNA-binding protein [Kordiimonas sp. SCSIO 12610]UTW56564.1 MmcQ/YjbR family DNA-binding protein [Kordiimonas sp. SCSIO 12610]
MTRDEFDHFCSGLKATTNVIQWGNSSVWKVGGKIFAIASVWGDGNHSKINFKCSDLSYQILCELEGIIPAPYLARAKWVQVEDDTILDDDTLKSYITEAHEIIAAKLTKKLQKELGLL